MSNRGLKAMARTKSPKFGHFIVEFATPGIGHIMKSAGCEFVLFDLEHSRLRLRDGEERHPLFRGGGGRAHRARAVQGISPHRPGLRHGRRRHDAADGGRSAKEARHILDCMKYDPQGKRGVALGVAHDRYRPGPVMEKFKTANETTTLFCQIETAEGVKNADEMAAMDGVDCLWVGHFDLSSSLGVPGQFQHPTFLKAIDKVANACAKHGKSLGRLVPDVATGIEYNNKWGFDFICYSGDVWVLHNALQDAVNKLKDGCKSGGKSAKSGKGKNKK